MNVIIVEDSHHFRLAVKTYLEKGLGHSVIADVSSCDDLKSITNLSDADIVFIGFRNDFANNIKTFSTLVKEYPHMKLIALSMEMQLSVIAELFKLGFNGFIQKDKVFDEMSAAIDTVMYNNVYIPMNVSQ